MVYRRTPEIQARLDGQRAAILQAAAGLLADGGYAACSVAAVAARAQIAAGTVYRHFDNKAALVAEVFRSVVAREVAAVRAAAASPASPAERLTAIVETFAGRALKSPRLAYALLAEPVDPLVHALRLDYRIAFRDVIVAVVAEGVAVGTLPPQNAIVVASALVGALGEALVLPLAAGVADPDTVPTLIAFVIRAIGASHVVHP